MNTAIAYMAKNTVAANLLMVLILIVGTLSFVSVPQEVFPEASLDAIQVRTEYRGASPEEVDRGIVRRIEEGIDGVEGIDRITSVAVENLGVVTAQLKLGADTGKALEDIKAAVDRITTIPAEAERPVTQELVNRRQAVQLAVHGPVSERALKQLAARIKEDLTALDEISYVRTEGVRDYEIAIEVPEAALGAYGLRLMDVAAAVRRGSLDLPGGSVETDGEEILVRSTGQSYTAREFEDIVVLATPDGATVRLSDIATVTDGFAESDLITRFGGQPAALVAVSRTADERVLDIVTAVEDYLRTLRPTLPEGVSVDIWQNESKLLESRLNLLVRNGVAGLILVLLALLLFMDAQLAFWTAVGLFLSFVGGFVVMVQMGVSINMISLFGFIVAIGIVVDDAIVIGENIYRENERGTRPLEAAVRGATRLAMPVTFAVLTTIAAFSPLLFVPGMIGKLMRTIPIIVISVLAFSLIESMFILPAHLTHLKRRGDATKGVIVRTQKAVGRALERFTQGPLDAALRFAVRRSGFVLSCAIATVILSAGALAGGLVTFTFFPEIEGQRVSARLELPQGTTAERTRRVADAIEAMGRETMDELQAQLPADHPPLVNHTSVVVGEQPSLSVSPVTASTDALVQSNIAEVTFELLDAELRELPAEAFERAWRERTGTVPGVSSLVFESSLITLGSAVQAEISADGDEALRAATQQFKTELARYAGVFDVADNRDVGKREVHLELREDARTLGLSLDDMARQVRAAYWGVEAVRIQRGRDDIRVMVRLPASERNALADLHDLRIRTQAGAEIPLPEVAHVSLGAGPAAIERRDRRRVVTVTADVNTDEGNADAIIADLSNTVIPAMQREYPGLRVSFEGQQQQQRDAMGALARGFVIALFVIYALLAIPFRSYAQPLIVMAAVPFGAVGALVGHAVLGVEFSILSVFGIVALSGVVVNDSLILIDFVNERRRAGLPMAEAVREAGKVRFRPILLTSLTTFLGVLPLILERSLQAQFLIPMAVSLGVGILFATAILMLLVPALTMLHHRLVEAVRLRSRSY